MNGLSHHRRGAVNDRVVQPTQPFDGLREPRVFNHRSRKRFSHERTLALVAHLGRPPSYTEKILISRCIANEWDLRKLDDRLDRGEELSGHAARLRLALENRLRLDLRELGFAPRPPPVRTLEDVKAELALAAEAARRPRKRAAR